MMWRRRASVRLGTRQDLARLAHPLVRFGTATGLQDGPSASPPHRFHKLMIQLLTEKDKYRFRRRKHVQLSDFSTRLRLYRMVWLQKPGTAGQTDSTRR
ncbi:uncharacterized protein BDV17DRAFT_221569 [Aspergillus undulatus]|uniref:uncharacterized protein n=1 Tax=Aspergillus undulatus TaxID=1810928 RepID=UPI003CCD2C7A